MFAVIAPPKRSAFAKSGVMMSDNSFWRVSKLGYYVIQMRNYLIYSSPDRLCKEIEQFMYRIGLDEVGQIIVTRSIRHLQAGRHQN